MFKTFNIIKILLILTIMVFLGITSCASSKSGSAYYKKKSQSSRVNASMMGRNKYYLSTSYQKKLKKNYKK
jgi:hypothetical protein